MEPSLKQVEHRTSNSVEERVVCMKFLMKVFSSQIRRAFTEQMTSIPSYRFSKKD